MDDESAGSDRILVQLEVPFAPQRVEVSAVFEANTEGTARSERKQLSRIIGPRPELDVDADLAVHAFDDAEKLVLGHQPALLFALWEDGHQVGHPDFATRGLEGCDEYVRALYVVTTRSERTDWRHAPETAVDGIQRSREDG